VLVTGGAEGRTVLSKMAYPLVTMSKIRKNFE
jgi:hypothetical protein